jgi:integrase
MASEWLGTDITQALARAEHLNKMWDDIRTGKKAVKIGPARGTLAWLLDDIERSDDFRERRHKIRGEISRAFAIIGQSPIGKAPIAEITGRDAKLFHRKLVAEFGVSKAQRTMKWLRYALNVAVQQKMLAGTPMHKMRIERPPPRQIWWGYDEVAKAAATAHQMGRQGRQSLALAIWLAYDLGQREGDIIALKWSQITTEGEVRIMQSKTSADIQVPLLPETLEELRITAKTSTHLVVSEMTRRPYKQFNFIHRIAEVIEAAGLKGKTYGDLRRSAVVRMDQAGCTTGEIASVTGHSEQSVTKIIATYRPATTLTARNAQAKVMAFNARRKA